MPFWIAKVLEIFNLWVFFLVKLTQILSAKLCTSGLDSLLMAWYGQSHPGNLLL